MSDFKCIFCQNPITSIDLNGNAVCQTLQCNLHNVYLHFNKENKLIQTTFHSHINNINYWFWYYEDHLTIAIKNQLLTIMLSSPFQVIISPNNMKTKLPTLLTYS